jgi:hypothetical protein
MNSTMMQSTAGATSSQAVKPSRDIGPRRRAACVDAALLIAWMM